MKQLNLWITDLPYNVKVSDFNIYKWLVKEYEVNLTSSNPDYIISSVFGERHLKYRDAVKILISGENISPDFNVFDYAVTSDPIRFNDRHLRIPYWALRLFSKDQAEVCRRPVSDRNQLLHRKFCNFVYSNSSAQSAMPERERIFRELSKYKRVDSGGSFLNNIGKRVKDKMEFIENYKFTIAYENSIKPGYSTEKILEPLIVNSVPIYLGDPEIKQEFNPKAFINAADFRDIEELLEYIKYLDNNDKEYLQMLEEPVFKDGKNLVLDYHELLSNFLRKIFDQNKSDAFRRCAYGWSVGYAQRALDERIKMSLQCRVSYVGNYMRRFLHIK